MADQQTSQPKHTGGVTQKHFHSDTTVHDAKPQSSNLVRFSVAMPEDLLLAFDDLVARRGLTHNRSEVIRDLVREQLVDEALEVPDGEVVGSITMVYDHHTPGLAAHLDKIQHRHATEVVSALHVHLDHDNCLELIAVRGQGRIVANMADCMMGLKGVRYGKLTCVAAVPPAEGASGTADAAGHHAHAAHAHAAHEHAHA